VSESSLEGVRTDHTFELRSTGDGAEVWRSSVLHAGGDSCASGSRLVGWLSSRQVIELLVEIERSGVYEALPATGVVPGVADPLITPCVSMRLTNSDAERALLDHVPTAHSVANSLVRTVREAVEAAQERALTAAG
jgi:hypothetical protein